MPLYPLSATVGDPTDTGYDLVLVLGQSNAVGFAPIVDGINVTHPDVFQYAVSGTYANEISRAVEPLGHPDSSSTGVGFALQWARWYRNAIPGNRRVLLVPAGRGATSLCSDYVHGWKRGVAGNSYADAITQAQAALTAAGANSRFAAVLWHQGESDANCWSNAAEYRSELDILINGIRADLGVPDLPFILGGMVPEYNGGTEPGVRAVHVDTPYRVARTAYCPGPAAMKLDDGLHYTARGYAVLARSLMDGYLDAKSRALPLTRSVPAQVTGLTRGQAAATSVDLSWTAPTGAVTYVIERSPAGAGTWTTIGETGQTSHTAVGLTAATAYDFRVSAKNAAGTGTVSSTVTATTGAHTAYDTFTRANSSSLGSTETGSKAWSTVGSSGWAIDTNALKWTGTAGDGEAMFDSGLSDNYEISFTATAVNGQYPLNVIFRGADTGHYLFAFRDQVENGWTLLEHPTAAGNIVSFMNTDLVAGDIITARVQGTTLTLRVNGYLRSQWTGISLQAGGTYVGVAGNANAALTVDNFSASPLVGVADTFTRANSSSLGSTEVGGKAWSTIGGSGWAISGNQLVWSGTSDGRVLVDSGLTDNYEVSFTVVSQTGQFPITLSPRATGTTSRFYVYRDQTANTWTLINNAGGGNFSVSSSTDIANGDVLSCQVQGTTITLYINGTQVGQWTGVSYEAGGTVQGITGNANNGLTIDNFVVRPI